MSYQREYSRRLRVGIVGVGSHAYRNILPALHYLPVSLVAMCDLNAELLGQTAAEYGGVTTFTDAAAMYAAVPLDAVLICAGPRQHPALTIQALRVGLHVWLEKPPAMRAHEVEAMIAARGDRVCAVGFKKAYMPATQKAAELLALPEFGALRSILAVYPMTITADGAGVLARGEFTNWLGNGIHPLSLMLALGGPVTAVTTMRGPGAEAVGAVHLAYTSGAMGTFFMAGGSPPGYPVERYELYGDRHAITIENSARVAYHRGIPFEYSRTHDFTAAGTDTGSIVWEIEHRLATLENKALFVQGVVNELDDFCGAVLDARPLHTANLEFALHLMRVYEAGLISQGHPVAVAQTGQDGVAP